MREYAEPILFDAGTVVAGVDEAGRGPLAGPVMAAAVVLDDNNPVEGLADSKALSPSRRTELATRIRAQARAWCVASATTEEIDRLNILQASLLAMQRAVLGLGLEPGLALVDGNQKPPLECPMRTVVKGDVLIPAISAASILAKVERDLQMIELDRLYPEYGFAIHKGYPTAAHLSALELHGVSPVHRRSFAPVKRLLINK